MKRSAKFVTSVMLTATLLVPAMGVSANGDSSAQSSNEKFRVLVDSANQKELKNAKDRYGVHWDFEGEGFTTDMNA